MKNHFSRNTHNANIKILKLPEIEEKTIWLKFTDTERMIYNAYLADPNNTVYDVFLRQICCHPMISEKLRENLTNKVESLTDIQVQIKKMYFSEFDKADEHYKICQERIERITGDIVELENEHKTKCAHYYKNPKLCSFWNNLKKGFDIFEQKKTLPKVSVDKQGQYVFN